ncbi:MAG: MoxR family ATPase [Verrucomicrobiota bacterium]
MSMLESREPLDPTAQTRKLIDNVSLAFIGKEEVVTKAILVLVSSGHVLVEDVPGLGKTLLAKAIAKSISAEFKRIQFTADLLPSDITGVTIFSQERHEFSFRKGPIFTNILLGDEINRATPRTQSSLLEAMEEQHVTVDGMAYSLESPFFVMATQNPVELEGTYPLPFAQMDRFMLRLSIGYLERAAEMQMLRSQQTSDPLALVKPVTDCQTLVRIQTAVRCVSIEDSLLGYLVDIVQATRSMDSLEYGASPRGSLDLQRYCQALALLDGRAYVLPDDIKKAARAVLPHRFICRKGTRAVSVNAGNIVDRILESVPVPM